MQDKLILRFPLLSSETKLLPFQRNPTLLHLIDEYSRWQDLTKCGTVAQINDHIVKGTIHDIKWLAEGLHYKKLFDICDQLISGFPQRRIITIAGPSSANKTTTSLRLSVNLGVYGFKTGIISLDDFYKPDSEIPIEADGKRNYEKIDALNLDLIKSYMEQLLEGKKIKKLKNLFDGRGGQEINETIQLKEKEFIILEGIHGLNKKIVDMIGGANIFKIFVNPYNLLQIDKHHYIKNSDTRLIRRIVRDYKFRKKPAELTLNMWKTIREHEEIDIFPYLADCDVLFNTSLVYELPVLAKYAKALLLEVPESHPNFYLVHKLLFLLGLFYPFDDEKKVPGISFLREFIGESDFLY